ncbi:hypothetical protein [Proteus mirabilis]|uniref:hypothetical protein n=1 Tax=Proteus mirabilis TaxID=584 RepID=UPI0035588D99
MDKSREQFEEWRSKNKSSTINLFDVWKASRESLEIELPERKNYSGFQQFDNGYERAIDDLENILISNGVKVK